MPRQYWNNPWRSNHFMDMPNWKLEQKMQTFFLCFSFVMKMLQNQEYTPLWRLQFESVVKTWHLNFHWLYEFNKFITQPLWLFFWDLLIYYTNVIHVQHAFGRRFFMQQVVKVTWSSIYTKIWNRITNRTKTYFFLWWRHSTLHEFRRIYSVCVLKCSQFWRPLLGLCSPIFPFLFCWHCKIIMYMYFIHVSISDFSLKKCNL